MQNQQIGWKSPSNIAIVKYWGKRPIQIPENPSFSFTLQQAVTKTSLSYMKTSSSAERPIAKLYFDGTVNEYFTNRVNRYLHQIKDEIPWIKDMQLRFESENTFPHSTGIASSASAFGAIALCLTELEQHLEGNHHNKTAFYRRASFLARLGSGSACRSIYPSAAIWGDLEGWPFSNDYAVPASQYLGNEFKTIGDAILIVDSKPKKISSSVGHNLMNQNVYATSRYQQARNHMNELLQALSENDWEKFIAISEHEALTLHALMMSSKPSYLLLQPNSLHVIELIREFRRSTHIPCAFTIDAGPNIHFLYRLQDHSVVHQFIENQLSPFLEEGRFLLDSIGEGPKKLNNEMVS